MAVRYVKDFEFPAASGYTKSATPVTGQMLAKGGPAKGGPKGVMVVIGVGKPMKKAEGGDVKTPEQREAELSDQRRGARVMLGKDKDKKARGGKVMRAEGGGVSDADRLNQMFADAAAANDAERTMSGKSKAPPAKKAVPVAKRGSPYVPGTNIRADEIYSKEAMDRLTRGYKKGGRTGYAEGGEAPNPHLGPNAPPMPSDDKINKENWNERKAIRRAMGAKKTGSDTWKKGGPAPHEDAAMDKALIKKMVRPDAMVGKNHGGKVMKKADGGMMAAPQPTPLPMPQAPLSGSGNMAREGIAKMREMGRGMMEQRARSPGNQPPMGNAGIDKMREMGRGIMEQRARMAGPGRKVPSPMPTPLPMPAPMAMKNGGKAMKKAAGGAAIPPQMPLQGPPLQSMPAAVRAPAMGRDRAPMIVAEPSTARVAVNAKRPGGPNVGKLRARMAKAASMANPDSAPAMMKKGGKTNC